MSLQENTKRFMVEKVVEQSEKGISVQFSKINWCKISVQAQSLHAQSVR